MVHSNLAVFSRQKLKDFVPEIDARIAEYFDEEIKRGFGFNGRQKKLVKQMLEHAREYILRPTKRLRASFVHYGYKLSGLPAGRRCGGRRWGWSWCMQLY